jgi:hypothetical protein
MAIVDSQVLQANDRHFEVVECSKTNDHAIDRLATPLK